MKKYIFLVEGISDLIFLRDFFINAIDDSLSVTLDKNDQKNIKLTISDNINFPIDALFTGGYTSIKKYFKIRIAEYVDMGYQIVLIYDTDNPKILNGGYSERVKYLQKIAEEFNVKFTIFLFPNNRDNGDLETLLIDIVNETKYQPYYASYSSYANSINSFSSSEFSKELLCLKHLVFSYFQVYFGMKHAKEEYREYKKEFWEYNHIKLEPLKRFIKALL
jgi:hypothetical protein